MKGTRQATIALIILLAPLVIHQAYLNRGILSPALKGDVLSSGSESSVALPMASEGEEYSANIELSLNFKVISGTLPPGIQPATDGTSRLTGTPTRRGKYAFTLQALDRWGNPTTFADTGSTMEQTYTLTVTFSLDLNGDGEINRTDWELWESNRYPTLLTPQQKAWLIDMYLRLQEIPPDLLYQ